MRIQSTANKNTVVNRYLSEIRGYPVLTREQEHDLARGVKSGCQTSRNELIESNLSFVVKVANEYRNLGLPLEDLLNEGNLGLIEAARRFDASKGTKFITYAIWWIRKSIFRALSERSNLVRVPTYQMKKVREYRETEQRLSAKLGRPVKREEICRGLDRSMAKVDQALQFNLREVGLEHRVGRDRDQPISDYLVDEQTTNAEEDMIRREDNDLMGEALLGLSNQEKTVVGYRFGLNGAPAMTLKEVGAIMGISRERVRQVEVQAKRHLRRVFDERRSVSSPDKPLRFRPNRVGFGA